MGERLSLSDTLMEGASLRYRSKGSIIRSYTAMMMPSRAHGKVMMILAYPYREDCVGAYDRKGESLKVELIA